MHVSRYHVSCFFVTEVAVGGSALSNLGYWRPGLVWRHKLTTAFEICEVVPAYGNHVILCKLFGGLNDTGVCQRLVFTLLQAALCYVIL